MPEAPKKESVLNKPLTTLPPVKTEDITKKIPEDNSQEDIDVDFAPDTSEIKKPDKDSKSKEDPDDTAGPAQYAGEADQNEKEKKENPLSDDEPEDMMLD